MSDLYNLDNERLHPYCDGTRMVLMAKDPHCLYVYWDLSPEAKDRLRSELGGEIWERSVPVLKITNVSTGGSFIIRINDFADNWHINIENPGSLYTAELGRLVSDSCFISFASSNCASAPREMPSANNSAIFINYRELKHGKLDVKSHDAYDSYAQVVESPAAPGISLPEFMETDSRTPGFGISSAEAIIR